MNSNSNRLPTRKQIGEASAWMAVLRAPDRTLDVEHGFQRWLTESPGHQAAFEAVSTAWEETAGLSPVVLKPSRSVLGRGFGQGFFAAAAALGLIAIAALLYYQHRASVETDIGEQRTVTLQDGSRIYLNTGTRVVIRYSDRVRKVELKRGEALFDVARVSDRPFVVQAGNREIRALGTAFVVREDASRFAVTLVEGKISVSGPSISGEAAVTSAPMVLSPGERLTLAPHQRPQLDQPMMEKVTAWRTGEVDLVEVRLADAAAEMNRYSRTQVIIERRETAGIRVSGIFRAGDTTSFAQAIANTYGLQAKQEKGRIVIMGAPPAALKPN